MKKQISNKLRSNQGASVILALLLFLVCAVVGSIVLTAATVSAGRMSKLVEMDQRYYSVTSAAELLRSQLNGAKIRITCRKGVASHNNPVMEFTNKDYIDSKNNVTPIPETNPGLFYYQALSVLNDSGDADWIAVDLTGNDLSSEGYQITAIATGLSNDSKSMLHAKVFVNKITAPQRGLRFTVQNDNGDSNLYQIPMSCTADVLKEVAGEEITYTVTWTVFDLGK